MIKIKNLKTNYLEFAYCFVWYNDLKLNISVGNTRIFCVWFKLLWILNSRQVQLYA